MYNLGDQFKLGYNPKSNEEATIKGEKYRITILTDRLIRFEYNDNGFFEDRATELVINRNFTSPKFKKVETETTLFVSTPYFSLIYQKEKFFEANRFTPDANLRVEIIGTNKSWYYKMPEIRNYGSPSFELPLDNGKARLRKSLYSLDGFTTIDDSNTKVFDDNGVLTERENKGVDLYLFVYNNDFMVCLKDYYEITGYPSLIPRYTLGNWWYRNYGYNEEEVKKLVDKFYDKGIPLSIILLNKDWHINPEGNEDTGFTFNKNKFDNPKELTTYLHSKGIRLGLSINPIPGIYPFEESYEDVKKYLQPNENGIIPFEIMNPRFVDAYFKLIIHRLDNLGTDFYWIDYFDKKNLNNLFILKHYHFYDMKRDYKRRPMGLTHNSLIASHRYPILYSGKSDVSWETLKAISFHNINATNMGVTWWSHDIGGYSGGVEDNELYIRFVQLGTFSPILKFGSDECKYYKREPWRWSIKTYTIAKDYLTLRHRLISYLYSEAYANSKYGIPVIKPLYYSTPEMYDDPLYRTEYYFGSQLFISPITNSKDYIMNRAIHKFYIPEGTWYDYVTGKKFPGDRKYVSFFKDQDYPVFAKAGAIIPLGNNKNINDTTPPTDMEIHIFPGRSNSFKLYEDDGISNLYLKDYYLLTSIEYNYMPNNYTVIMRAVEGKSGIIPEKRNYKFRFRNTKKAEDVIVYSNKDVIPHTSYVDKEDFIVEVNSVDTIGKQLTVNCKGNDIEIDAVRLINDDIESILSDLQIETEKKEKIDKVLFSNLPINKKRIEVRRLTKYNIDKKFIQLFLKLLEYIEQM